MARLCERPGCSAPASVTYGFEAKRSVVWLGVLAEDPDRRHLVGVLCRRHADALTPPRGWWLDDRRIAVPTLFQVAPAQVPEGEPSLPAVDPVETVAEDEITSSLPRRRRRLGDDTEELAFDFGLDDSDSGPSSAPEPTPTEAPSHPSARPRAENGHLEPASKAHLGPADPDETKAIAWTPVFDRSDDLGGVLSARSPLLARAFGLDGRPR